MYEGFDFYESRIIQLGESVPGIIPKGDSALVFKFGSTVNVHKLELASPKDPVCTQLATL